MHEVLQEGDAICPDSSLCVADVVPSLVLPLREGVLEIRQVCEPRPLLNRRRTEILEDLEDSADLRVPAEQRTSRRHLCQDTPDAPHVRRPGTRRSAKQGL